MITKFDYRCSFFCHPQPQTIQWVFIEIEELFACVCLMCVWRLNVRYTAVCVAWKTGNKNFSCRNFSIPTPTIDVPLTSLFVRPQKCTHPTPNITLFILSTSVPAFVSLQFNSKIFFQPFFASHEKCISEIIKGKFVQLLWWMKSRSKRRRRTRKRLHRDGVSQPFSFNPHILCIAKKNYTHTTLIDFS